MISAQLRLTYLPLLCRKTCSTLTPTKSNVGYALNEYTIDINIFKPATPYLITATAFSYGQESRPSQPAQFRYRKLENGCFISPLVHIVVNPICSLWKISLTKI